MCASFARSCASKRNSQPTHRFSGPPIAPLCFKIIPLLFSYTSFPPAECYLNDRLWKSLFPYPYPSEEKASVIIITAPEAYTLPEQCTWYVTTFHATNPVFYSFSQVPGRWVFQFSFRSSFSLTTPFLLLCLWVQISIWDAMVFVKVR